jgi:hypothetical protein
MLNQYKTELPDLWESTNYLAEWLGGYLWVTDKVAGEERLTKMTNTNGNNITKGEFSRGVDSHGFDKACQVFFKLGVNNDDLRTNRKDYGYDMQWTQGIVARVGVVV